MTTIEKIGQFTIAQHGPVYVLIDRETHTIETHHTYRAAHDTALDRVDVVDHIAATVH